MQGEQRGGVVIGKKKAMLLVYLNDLVLMAKIEEEMRIMLDRFRQYVKKKILIHIKC